MHTWFRGVLFVILFACAASVWMIYRYEQRRPSASERIAHDERLAHMQRDHVKKPQQAQSKISKPLNVASPLPHETNGLAPVLERVDTDQPVVFLTIDDGAYKDLSVIAVMEKYHLKASLFLSKLFIGSNPEFFARLTKSGSLIENHTLSHDLRMSKVMNYVQQKREICSMADYEQARYGRRPLYYRPPGGTYTDVMRRAAHDCGMKAVVTWMVTVNDGSLQYQVGDKLRAADIVLMHFRPTFVEDIEAFVREAKRAGLRPTLLEDVIAS